MDLNRFQNAATTIAEVLDRSGLNSAIEKYSLELRAGDGVASEKLLTRASEGYMNQAAAAYGENELLLVNSLQLDRLQSPSYWFDACSPVLSLSVRLHMLEQALWHLKFASQQFPEILAVVGAAEVGSADTVDSSSISVKVVDAVDKASDPDRISRLIDGVDMIYRACANLAGQPEDGLKLMSVRGGTGNRTVVFHGHQEVSTATRRIIGTLHQHASSHLKADTYSVERIAEQLPFMHAIDELYRVGALEAGFANDISDGVLAGSIMLLECGARIYHGANSSPVEVA